MKFLFLCNGISLLNFVKTSWITDAGMALPQKEFHGFELLCFDVNMKIPWII